MIPFHQLDLADSACRWHISFGDFPKYVQDNRDLAYEIHLRVKYSQHMIDIERETGEIPEGVDNILDEYLTRHWHIGGILWSKDMFW